jgi:hypothetical protein
MMANKFTRSILLAVMAAGACFATGAASAQVCINGMHGATDLGPDASCPTTAESDILLSEIKDNTTALGNIGSHTGVPVQFTSSVALDLSAGNSTIIPAAHGPLASLPSLDFTIPGHTFTDFLFHLQMVNTAPENLTVDAWSGTTVERTFTYTGLPHDADLSFIISDPAGLTAIDLSSTTGIKQGKMFAVSGVSAVPEPSTWAMMVFGLVGLGLAALRRTGRPRLSGAMA